MRTTFLLLATLLISAPAVPARAQGRAAELGAAAWQAIQKNDGAAASLLFAQALALQPRDAVLQLGAGAAAHMLGHEEAATRALQQALEIDPTLSVASKLLAEIAYQSGDIGSAIEIYERALAHAPDSVELSARLDRLSAEAVRRGGAARFTVTIAGVRQDALAAHATQVIDAAYWRIAKMVGAYPSDPITVELNTARPFRDVNRTPSWSDAQFDGRIAIDAGGAADDLQAFDRVLTHELTHAMVTSMAPTGVPAWFHEGLAQLVEPADGTLAERRLQAAGTLPWPSMNGALARETLDAQLHYDISLLIVRALLDRIGAKSTMLLDELTDGQPLDTALAQFGFSYADLQADVTRCLR